MALDRISGSGRDGLSWGGASGRVPRCGAHHLAPGRLAVADPQSVHALLFDSGVTPGHEAGTGTERIALFSVGVDGVPAIHIEEALWVCVEALSCG